MDNIKALFVTIGFLGKAREEMIQQLSETDDEDFKTYLKAHIEAFKITSSILTEKLFDETMEVIKEDIDDEEEDVLRH